MNDVLDKRNRHREREKLMKAGQPIPPELQLKRRPNRKPGEPTSLARPLAEYEALPWAPWQQFRAIDRSGDAWAFEQLPKKAKGNSTSYTHWKAPGRVQYLGEFDVTGHDWQGTLRAKQ